MWRTLVCPLACSTLLLAAMAQGAEEERLIKVGIIGLDTSHAIAFTQLLNDKNAPPELAGCRVVAAYPQGSPDIESSVSRVPKYKEDIRKLGVEIVDSIDELLQRVDAVLLETNDGRPHLEQARAVYKAGKPVFIDKPIAGSLRDAVAILAEAKAAGVPMFSSSSLRYGENTQAARGGAVGRVEKCETSSPASIEPTHPDLFWYGIHGVESLFTVMGTGCQSVVRTTENGKIVVTGKWTGGRVGVFRENKAYVGKVLGEKGQRLSANPAAIAHWSWKSSSSSGPVCLPSTPRKHSKSTPSWKRPMRANVRGCRGDRAERIICGRIQARVMRLHSVRFEQVAELGLPHPRRPPRSRLRGSDRLSYAARRVCRESEAARR